MLHLVVKVAFKPPTKAYTAMPACIESKSDTCQLVKNCQLSAWNLRNKSGCQLAQLPGLQLLFKRRGH